MGWARAIITRCVAVVPCVAVAVGADSKAMEQMINIVNSSLAFLLPFALIPLVRLTTSSQYMGRFVSGKIEAILIWAATLLCFGINFYTLVAPDGHCAGHCLHLLHRMLCLHGLRSSERFTSAHE